MAKGNDEKPAGDKPNDSASRAGQFLDGPVTQAFCSPDQAGYRCATQTPGCEPTGFTGQCTKQPEVGGAWPCITAMPFCAEPTGYTGQCTDQPWPNPTRYAGCTVLHCPTNDLTHQPQICRVVEDGLRGGAPPQAKGAANAEAPGAQPTAPLGCGYTQTWGLCPTHLLGCGYTKQWGPQCPPQQQQQNFAAVQQQPTYPNGDCTFFGCPPQTLIPPQCQSVANPCITQTETPDCGAQVGGWPSLLCPSKVICVQPVTTQPQCFLRITQRCPEFTPGCPWVTPKVTPQFQPQFDVNRAAGGGFVGAAGAAPATAGADVHITLLTFPPQFCAPTPATRCFICPPLQQHSRLPWFCPPSPAFPLCPPHTIGIACTVVRCFPGNLTVMEAAGGGGGGAVGAAAPTPSAMDACPTRLGCPTYPNGDCTFFGCGPQGGGGGQTAATVCTQYGPGCQTYPNGDCTFFGCGPQGGGGGHTAATVCTQYGPGCQTYPNGDCTFFGCGPQGGGGGQSAATVCTQSGPGCFTYPNGDCTFFGCPPQTLIPQQCQSAANPCITQTETPDCGAQVGGTTIAGTICNIRTLICPQLFTVQARCITPITQRCPEFTPGCPWITPKITPVDPAPVFRGGGGFGGFVGAAGGGGGVNAAIPTPTPASRCFVCDPVAANAAAIPQTAATVCTQYGPGCHTYPNGDCTFFGCGPQQGQGQTQFAHQCQSAVDACPTRLCGGGGGGQFGAANIGPWPTPATRCFVCDPVAANAAMPTPSAMDACPTRLGCPTYPNGDCTFFGCGPQQGQGQTQFSHQCQSAVDACPTRLCGGGGGEQTGVANITIAPTPATRCFICPPPYGGGHWPTPMTRCFIC